MNLQKKISYVKSTSPNLSKYKVSYKDKKILVFVTKNALFEYFKTETLKNGWNVWNQPPQISHNAVFLENMYRLLFFLGCKLEKLSRYLRSSLSKMSKRKVLCRIWDQKCIFWVILDWNLKELLYFKPVPPNLSNFRAKIKLLKFETKNASCEYFRIVSSNKSKCKVLSKSKNPWILGPKMPYLGVLEL